MTSKLSELFAMDCPRLRRRLDRQICLMEANFAALSSIEARVRDLQLTSDSQHKTQQSVPAYLEEFRTNP